MVQGVREVFEIVDVEDGRGGDDRGEGKSQRQISDLGNGKLVFIGRGLDERAFGESLEWALRD